MNIYEKLLEVRKAVPYLKKESQGQQYKYVSSSQVLQSLREAMDEQKLLLIPKVIDTKVSTEMVEWQDKEKPKKTTTYFTELTMEFVWVNAEKPDEIIVCPWYGQGVDIAGEKGVGKALTYAEKYFLLKSFNVATDKDDPDSFQEKGNSNGKNIPTPARISKGQTDKLKELAEQLNLTATEMKDRIKADYKASGSQSLTGEQADDLIAALQSELIN